MVKFKILLPEHQAKMGSVTSRTGVIALTDTDYGDNSDTVSESGATGHGSWATLPNSGRRTASAPTKTRSNPSRLRTRTKTSTELDFHEMKMELKRYKKYVLEAQDQECVTATKLKEVEKQMAELEGTNLKLQDEVQLLEDKVEYLQESGPAAEPQPHNYTEMLKLKDKYIQKLGKETHAIRAEVTQLKSKYKKKLKEKTSQISELRQLHCIQMMEIKTEMDKLMEENENLSDQLSRSDHGHTSDMRNLTEGATSKHDDRRTDVIVELSSKVSEQETRIIGLENKLFQREKHLNDLLDRTKSSRSRPDVEDGGDTRQRRDCDGPPTHTDRHCHSDVMMGDWEKRSPPQTQKHGSDSRLGSGRTHTWDEAPHDTTSAAKTKNKSPTGTAVHKGHAFNYMTSRCVQRDHAQSYSSGSDLSDNGEDDCWDDEDFSAGDKRSNGFHTSVNSAFYGVVEDSVGHGRHSHHTHSRKSTNKNQTNDLSATESPKLRHRQRNDSTAELTEPTGDSRHTARSHTDTAHSSQ